jgi:hypothetical protein
LPAKPKKYTEEDWDSPDGPCAEPDGNIFNADVNQFQHDLMLDLAGQCPWCGKTDSRERQ